MRLSCERLTCRLEGIGKQGGDRHRPHSARDGRDRADMAHLVECSVPNDAPAALRIHDPGDANVDYHGARFHHLRQNQIWLTGRNDKNIR